MGFFNTFSEISKNKDNFKQWEQQKADQEAKREKYFAQNPTSEQQAKKSKEFGRVIVDSVDFMDAQSENKSESVEMATGMTAGIAGIIGTIVSMAVVTKQNFKNSAALDETHKKLRELLNELNHEKTQTPQQEAIIKDLLDQRVVTDHGDSKYISLRHTISGTSILDKKKFEKLQPATKEYFKDVITENVFAQAKKASGGLKRLAITSTVAGLGIGIVSEVVGTLLQIKASRVARYQARESLKDTKNFVEYTDEQKEEAKKHVSEIKIKKEKKSGSFKDIVSLLKDYKGYEAESKKLSNLHLYDVQESDPQQGYEKQKIINNVIKKINNAAENYAQNMETAAEVILGCSVLGGALFGAAAQYIIKKVDESNLKKGKQVLEEIAENESFFKNPGKKLLAMAKANPKTFGAFLATIIAIPISTKLTKEASRAGRYKAKRELEENPQNFIYVENEKLSSIDAKGIVPKEGFIDIIKFIPEAFKTIREYGKYKKTTLQERKALHEALKNTEISETQMKDATALQQRLYKSFDVIDDHSEEYSEKMEAAGEIAKDVFNGVLMPAAFAVPGIIIAKNPQKVIKPATDLLAGVFKNFKGFTKKYASNIGEHAVNKMTRKAKDTWEYRQLSFVEKEIDEILKTTDKNEYKTKMEALKEKMQPKLGDRTDWHIEQIEKFKAKPQAEKVDLEVGALPKGSIKKLAKFIDAINDPEIIREELKKITQDMVDVSKLSNEEILKIKNNIKTIFETIPEEEFVKSMKILEEFDKQKTMKHMILANNKYAKMKPEDLFITKDIQPVYLSLLGAYVASVVGISYSVESFLASKQKKAGRLGTMKAIQDLDAENDKYLEMNQTKRA